MAGHERTVLTGLSLPDFIQHLEEESLATSLIICSTKDAFLEQLLATCMESMTISPDEAAETVDNEFPTPSTHCLLQQPSLRMLATSQRIKLVFCPDVSHLRAYLSIFKSSVVSDKRQLLAILNLLELHRPTSAFSAQGLIRTFSLAAEAALRTNSRLLICESVPSRPRTPSAGVHGNESTEELPADHPPAPTATDPWDEQVSILNVTTKSFGAGGRGWVGRTVKTKRIAERWCTFKHWAPRSTSPRKFASPDVSQAVRSRANHHSD